MSRLDVADGLPTVGGQVTLVCRLFAVSANCNDRNAEALERELATNSVEILLEGTGTLAMLKATRLSEGSGDDRTEARRTEAAVLLI